MLIKGIRYFNDNMCYIINNLKENYTFLVDPGDTKFILNYLKTNNIKIDHLLITHEHHDHIGDLNLFLEESKIKNVYAGKGKKLNIPENYNYFLNVKEGDKEFNYIEFDKQILLNFDNFDINIIPVPCHTRGSLYFNFINKENIDEREFDDKSAIFNNFVLTGDTIFIGGCGRLFEGSFEEMKNNINIAKNLDKNCRFLTGHDYMLSNLIFADYINPENYNYKKYIEIAKTSKNILQGYSLEEMNILNIFFDINNKKLQEKYNCLNELELFTLLRNKKDKF